MVRITVHVTRPFMQELPRVHTGPDFWRQKNEALKDLEIGHWSRKRPEKVLIFDHRGAEKSIRLERWLRCSS